MSKQEDKYSSRESERNFGHRFQGIIQRAFEQTGTRVVILVDEYDEPLLQAIGNEPLQTEYRNTLKAIYGALKSCDRYIRFAFLTGVTKFGTMSVFSDQNNQYLLPFYTPKTEDKRRFSIALFVKDVEKGDAEGFMRCLEAFFANGDYQVMGNTEIYSQNTLYVFFRLMGFYVDVERHTTDGRMDMLIQTPDYIYILELKINQTAAVALQQIEDKGYALHFASAPLQLFKIGINFSTDSKLIDDWAIA